MDCVWESSDDGVLDEVCDSECDGLPCGLLDVSIASLVDDFTYGTSDGQFDGANEIEGVVDGISDGRIDGDDVGFW